MRILGGSLCPVKHLDIATTNGVSSLGLFAPPFGSRFLRYGLAFRSGELCCAGLTALESAESTQSYSGGILPGAGSGAFWCCWLSIRHNGVQHLTCELLVIGLLLCGF